MGFGQSTIISGDNLNIGSGNSLGSVSHVYYGNAIGTNNHVVSPNTLAVGADDTIYYNSTHSVALGYRNYVEGLSSMAFGSNVKVVSDYGVGLGRRISVSGEIGSMAIGTGVPSSGGLSGSGDSDFAPLTNSVSNSLAIGFNSTKPTLFVSESPNDYTQSIINKTGRVAIGDVTPQAKLHIRSDVGEDAGIILAPANPNSENSFVRLRDNAHHITVDGKGEMQLSTSIDYPLTVTSKRFNLSGSLLELGLPFEERPFDISTEYTPCIGSNAYPTAGGYVRKSNGPSYVMEFGANGMLLRTSVYAPPTITQSPNVIDNWRDAISVKTDGDITLNGDMTLNGASFFNGKVGVNTENTTNDYALAVDGGVITTKVHIQDVADWQDRVFDGDYALMSLGEVEEYVAANRHLPGVPTEAEVKADGFDMAGMASILLGKVEELTLYAIRQQREIDSLRELVTVRFGYDACGNRTSRTLEFSRVDGDKGTGGAKGGASQWEASLSDSFAGVEAMLFPNPTEGGFFLAFSGEEIPNDATATLCSVDGKAIEERKVGGMTEEFDLRGKPAGVYLLRLSSSDSVKTWKIVKR